MVPGLGGPRKLSTHRVAPHMNADDYSAEQPLYGSFRSDCLLRGRPSTQVVFKFKIAIDSSSLPTRSSDYLHMPRFNPLVIQHITSFVQ